MYTRKIFLSTLVFIFAFIVQESIFNQFRLPLGGFSFFLIFTLSWAAMSTPELGALAGFCAGLLMDLSPTSDGPVGQWMLVLIAAGFTIAFICYGDIGLRSSPISLVLLITVISTTSLALYLALGAVLGMDFGTTFQIGKTLVGNVLWSLVIAPLVLRIASRLHRVILETRTTL